MNIFNSIEEKNEEVNKMATELVYKISNDLKDSNKAMYNKRLLLNMNEAIAVNLSVVSTVITIFLDPYLSTRYIEMDEKDLKRHANNIKDLFIRMFGNDFDHVLKSVIESKNEIK